MMAKTTDKQKKHMVQKKSQTRSNKRSNEEHVDSNNVNITTSNKKGKQDSVDENTDDLKSKILANGKIFENGKNDDKTDKTDSEDDGDDSKTDIGEENNSDEDDNMEKIKKIPTRLYRNCKLDRKLMMTWKTIKALFQI